MASFYNILKAKYFVDDNAHENWRFIVFIIFLAIVMIANTHRYENKILQIAALNKEVKELRSKFVDNRSILMELKMESTIAKKMEEKQIFPATKPPTKIQVIEEKKPTFWQKLWQ